MPGTFNFGWVQGPAPAKYRYLWVVLPCEGGELHGLPIRGKDSDPPKDRASWEWDGNEERPTLKPSILTWRRKDPQKPDSPANRQEVWHGFITAGRAVSC